MDGSPISQTKTPPTLNPPHVRSFFAPFVRLLISPYYLRANSSLPLDDEHDTLPANSPNACLSIDGLVRLMGSSDEVVGPINIGNPIEFSMLQLANVVCELTGSRSHIVYRPLPQDDPRQRQPDISKAQEILGWNRPRRLKEGLGKTIAYFEALLREPGILDAVGNGGLA